MAPPVTVASPPLAIFGQSPAFPEPLHVGRPNVGDRERFLARVEDILDRRWLTNDGPYVQSLQANIERLLGVKHCIAVCNATVGLELAIRALGLHGEVIVPSFTFVATAHALKWQEITPVFADVDPRTHTLDPEAVLRQVTSRTTGIIGVHTWGRGCDTRALGAIADEHGLKLLYDAAHAFHCTHGGRTIGNFGDAEVLSFHATKFFNTFEGGAVVTNDDDLAEKLRLMRNFGFTGYDRVEYIGTNGKMSEVAAAMGVTGLESLEEFVEVNRNNYESYRRMLAGIPGVHLIYYAPAERSNFQYVVLEVDGAEAGLCRDELVDVLAAENVLARRYFHPGCHRMEPYRSLYPDAARHLPHTEALSSRVMSLPTGTAVGAADIEVVCGLIATAVGHADAVRGRLRDTMGRA
jgi:dTDP-4-amino-4,6-dideoxygalactose transaminase